MQLAKYKAIICEGAAEEAIIDILLDNNCLIFERKELIEEQVIRCRSADSFENRYLKREFSGKISVIRVLDSRRERFRLSKAYQEKVDVINIITAPEIEMLIILNEGVYADYKKSGDKPSTYCKEKLKMKNVKSRGFVLSYFNDVDVLLSSIRKYNHFSNIPQGEYTLLDLLCQKD